MESLPDLVHGASGSLRVVELSGPAETHGTSGDRLHLGKLPAARCSDTAGKVFLGLPLVLTEHASDVTGDLLLHRDGGKTGGSSPYPFDCVEPWSAGAK